MSVAEFAEEIEVVGARSTFSETTVNATTFQFETVEKLATGRNVLDTILLAPGVQSTGPAADRDMPVISISGGQSFENLFLINGVVVNENLRGQPMDLFIEDAIQETTTSASSISAEYGRFTGGVVNAITKSGGNLFSGSFRTNLENQSWESKTPLTGAQEDKVQETLEGTLGGYVLKDRLWFFGAARTFDRSSVEQLQSGIDYPQDWSEDRLEGKLTASLGQSHTLLGSYIGIESTQTNNDPFGIALELNSLSDREDPQNLTALNYTGIVNENFLVEAQYSEREWTVAKGAGAMGEGRIEGTHFIDVLNDAATFYIPYFCGTCSDQTRDNEAILVKGSYFASTETRGSHDIVFGYDEFSDLVFSENHQSPSGFSVWADTSIKRGTEIFPVVTPGVTYIAYYPIETRSLGSNFTTKSAFVNDRWNIDDKLSLNIGVRYDQNDGADSSGATVSDDEAISARLAASYDLKGDGDIVLNASYGQYVAALNFGVGDITSTAGTYSIFYFDYQGPAINQDPSAPTLTSSRDAMGIIFNWFESAGDISGAPLLDNPIIPGVSVIVPPGLGSPNADEYSVGLIKRLGNKGLFRGDLIFRRFDDFYAIRRDLSTGQNTTPELGTFDVGEVVNENDLLEREYMGLHTQFSYQLTDKFTLAGNYTWSEAKGNFDGENRDIGPTTADETEYPEYKAFENHNPKGKLAIDSTHKFRLWAIYDVWESDSHNLSASILQSFNTGTPYGALGSVESEAYVTNPGYANPPSEVNYWFTARDAFRTDDVTSTDVALNYSFMLDGFGKEFEIFVQPEVENVFNENAALLVDQTAVLHAANSPGDFEPFNPFTETPVQGVHWDVGDDFGEVLRDSAYQQPRTFRLSVGFRF
jgi:outer membrane receptor protein involved in Fe transport